MTELAPSGAQYLLEISGVDVGIVSFDDPDRELVKVQVSREFWAATGYPVQLWALLTIPQLAQLAQLLDQEQTLMHLVAYDAVAAFRADGHALPAMRLSSPLWVQLRRPIDLLVQLRAEPRQGGESS